MAKKDKKSKTKKEKSKLVVTEPPPTSATDLKDNETDLNLTTDDITVPPPTPSSQFGLELSFQGLPSKLPNVDNLKIPVVRRNGIKLCIDTLAEYFQCQDYKFNHFQFWFLDVVTDCLWRAQDEFRFPDKLQKTVLNWILFIFDKIRDPQEDITRKKLFTIFKESILLGAEYVDEGGEKLPSPENLFVLMNPESNERSSVVTSSLSLHSSEKVADAAVLFNEKDSPQYVTLKQELCQCNQFDVQSVDSITESGFITTSESDLFDLDVNNENDLEAALEELKIGDPDSDEDFLVEDLKGDFEVVSAPSSLTLSNELQCPSDIFMDSVERDGSSKSDAKASSKASSNTTEEASEKADSFDRSSYNTKMRILTKYFKAINLNAQKAEAMNDSEKGWVPSEEEIGEASEGDNAGYESDEWVDIVDKCEADLRNAEDTAFINFGVLWAIIDFVFDYFYESFQFTLIKLAFREYPNIVCQRVNQEWKVPKVPKGEFVPPPVKKEKKGKEKKGKKGKKDKKGKKGKDKKKGKKDKKSKSSKKDKKSKKGSKKEKKSKKDKGSKKGKKEKKEKLPKLTKEEKEEMEKIRLEQERLEEDKRRREENKRLMFPLNEAANDDFFNQIFENWVKVDLTAERKGKGKGKKDKKKGKDKKKKK